MTENAKPTGSPSSGSSDSSLEAVLVLTRRRPALLRALWPLGEYCLPLNISRSSLDMSDLTALSTQYAAQPEMKTTVWARLLVDLE